MKSFKTLWNAGIFALVIGLVGGLVTMSLKAQTTTATIYLTPASSSVIKDQNLTLQIRINTNGRNVNAAKAVLSYDAAAFQFVNIDGGGSAFGLSDDSLNTGGNGSVSIERGSGTNITGDLLFSKVTFKALKDSGSSPVSFANGTIVADAGTDITGDKNGGTYTLTAPPADPPANPPANNGNTNTGNTNTGNTNTGNTNTGSGTTGSGTGNTGTPSSPGTGNGSQPTPPGSTPVNADLSDTLSKVEFSRVSINIKTAAPTAVYVNYGLNDKLGLTTPQSQFATEHNVNLDEKFLLPGTTYYYQVVAVDQADATTTGEVKSFTTKGFTVELVLVDEKKQPLKNSDVTLRSDPKTGKTDDAGKVSFSDVAPGNHEVEAKSGGRTLKAAINVNGTIEDVDGVQTASIVAMEVDMSGPSTNKLKLVALMVAILLAAAAAAVLVMKKKGFGPFGSSGGPTAPADPTDSITGSDAGPDRGQSGDNLTSNIVSPPLQNPTTSSADAPSASSPFGQAVQTSVRPVISANPSSNAAASGLAKLSPVSSHSPGDVIAPTQSK